MKLLLRTYSTDETVWEAHKDVVVFHKSSITTEEFYSSHFFDRALRCASVVSDRRLKSELMEGLLCPTCAQVYDSLEANSDADYRSIAKYAKVTRAPSRSESSHVTSAALHDGLELKPKTGEANSKERAIVGNFAVHSSIK